jgi:hypothetical protein
MSDKVRAAKRKAAIEQDEVRAAATVRDLGKSKERCKRLHSLVCEKAQEAIAFKNEIKTLKDEVRGLKHTNQLLIAIGEALAHRVDVLEAPDLD